MPRTTRATRKLREAEGIPASPQQELPQEPRRTKNAASSKTTKNTITKDTNKSSTAKKTTSKKTKKDAGRTAVTPESDGEALNPQNQENPTHALREGNVGGYVESAPSTRNSEPQDFLFADPQFPYAHHEMITPVEPPCNAQDPSIPEVLVTPSSEPCKFEQIAASVGIYRTSPPSNLDQEEPAERLHTPPQSARVSPIMHPVGESTPFAPERIVDREASAAQAGEGPSSAAKSVSTKTDRPSVGVVTSDQAQDASELDLSSEDMDADYTHWFEALYQHVPETKKVTPKESPKPPSRPVSAQEIRPPHIWRPLGLYMFRSELALGQRRSSIIINLGEDRHIRVLDITPEALHELASMLHAQGASFERSWLTDEDKAAALAAATAAEEARKASTKRKRDVEEAEKAEEERKAKSRKRRKVASSTPTPTYRMSRLRKQALKGRPAFEEWKRMHPERPVPPVEGNSYNRNGELQLIGPFSPEEDDYESSEGDEMNDVVPVNELGGAVATRMNDEASSNQQLIEVQTPQTPFSRLGRLFNSARQFIPSVRRPQLPVPAPQTIQPAVRTESIDDRPIVVPGAIDQPEPSVQDRQIVQVSTDSGFTERLHNTRKSQQKMFRNKQTIEELHRLRAEKNRLAKEWTELEKERQIQEQAKKDIDDAHRAAYAAQESEDAQQTGTKRKARISPKVIPNPAGASYGFDAAYFDTSCSEEEAEQVRSPPSKRQRRDSSKSPEPNDVLETLDEVSEPEPLDLITLLKLQRSQDPNWRPSSPPIKNFFQTNLDYTDALAETPEGEALHYKGAHFSDSPPNPFDQSTFQAKQAEREARRANAQTPTHRQIVQPDGTVLRMSDERFNNSGHFEVPFDSSSSEEGDSEMGFQDTTFAQQSPIKATTQQSKDDESSRPAARGPAMPVTQQPSLTPGQIADQSTSAFKPAETPAPKEPSTIFGHGKNTEASKTLERSRALLREQLAQKTGRSLLSPKDIVASPTKAASASQALNTPAANDSTTSALSQLAKFPSPNFDKGNQAASSSTSQPSVDQPDQASSSSENSTGQSSDEATSQGPQAVDDFSIMGAAGRTSPKSPGHRLAATLPTMQSQVSDLSSYKEYAQSMDPKVKEYLDLVWSAQDDSTAKSAFVLPFTSYMAEMQSEKQKAQGQQQEEPVFGNEDDNSEDDEELLYGNNGASNGGNGGVVGGKEGASDAGNGGIVGGTDGASDERNSEIVGRGLDMGNAYDSFAAHTADQQVKDMIDGHWTAEAKALASKKFSDEYAAWKAAAATEISQA